MQHSAAAHPSTGTPSWDDEAMENIHSETYSMLIEQYIKDRPKQKSAGSMLELQVCGWNDGPEAFRVRNPLGIIAGYRGSMLAASA